MAANNLILPFAPTDTGTNLDSQSYYLTANDRIKGNQPGIARSSLNNKALKQVSAIVVGLAQYLADRQTTDVADTLTPAQIEAMIDYVIHANSIFTGTDTGAANACVVNYTPAILTLTDGLVVWFTAFATNTGPTTLNVNGLGTKAILGGAHSAMSGNEIFAGGKCECVYSTALGAFILIEGTGASMQVANATKQNQAATLGQVVQAGTGVGQAANTVKMGWSGSRVKVTIDVADQGNIVFDSQANATYAQIGGSSAQAFFVGAAQTAQQAVQLQQLLAPVQAVAFANANNTTITVTASLTAPGPGILFAVGGRNNAGQTSGSNSAQIFINGNGGPGDTTTISTSHTYAVAISAGGAMTAAYTCAAGTAFSASIMLIFVPNV